MQHPRDGRVISKKHERYQELLFQRHRSEPPLPLGCFLILWFSMLAERGSDMSSSYFFVHVFPRLLCGVPSRFHIFWCLFFLLSFVGFVLSVFPFVLFSYFFLILLCFLVLSSRFPSILFPLHFHFVFSLSRIFVFVSRTRCVSGSLSFLVFRASSRRSSFRLV